MRVLSEESEFWVKKQIKYKEANVSYLSNILYKLCE